MGFCSKRYFFLSICLLQMVCVIEKQVFDFLGFLWIPILVNFFEIIFIILGFFGTYQYRPKYIISYLLWHLFWLGWNIFFICLYLDIGELDHKTNKVLKLDPKSESWWASEGPGCKKVVPLRDEPWKADTENCLFNYIYVELFQAGLQCVLAFFGLIVAIFLSRAYLEEDDTFNYEDAKGSEHLFLHPMYVSSDCLNNQHFKKSNNHLNVKSQLTNRQNRYNHKNKIASDTIRFPLKSNSFEILNNVNNGRSVRPKSLCSNSYFDRDYN